MKRIKLVVRWVSAGALLTGALVAGAAPSAAADCASAPAPEATWDYEQYGNASTLGYARPDPIWPAGYENDVPVQAYVAQSISAHGSAYDAVNAMVGGKLLPPGQSGDTVLAYLIDGRPLYMNPWDFDALPTKADLATLLIGLEIMGYVHPQDGQLPEFTGQTGATPADLYGSCIPTTSNATESVADLNFPEPPPVDGAVGPWGAEEGDASAAFAPVADEVPAVAEAPVVATPAEAPASSVAEAPASTVVTEAPASSVEGSITGSPSASTGSAAPSSVLAEVKATGAIDGEVVRNDEFAGRSVARTSTGARRALDLSDAAAGSGASSSGYGSYETSSAASESYVPAASAPVTSYETFTPSSNQSTIAFLLFVGFAAAVFGGVFRFGFQGHALRFARS